MDFPTLLIGRMDVVIPWAVIFQYLNAPLKKKAIMENISEHGM